MEKMSKNQSPANRTQLEDLELRLADMAQKKARHELLNRLLISLSSVAGLDNVVEHILNILVGTIGGANLSIYYLQGSVWHYRDIFGATRSMQKPDNASISTVLETGQPLRLDEGQTPYLNKTGSISTQTWIFPLISRERQVGAVCMEGMQLTDEGIWQDILPFFVYASLMLDNEICNYDRLAEAHLKLKDSETIYRTLFEQSPDGVQLTDPETTRPVYFNSAMHNQLGYTKEEYGALSVSDYEHLDDQGRITERVSSLRAGKPVVFETVYRAKGGGLINVHVSLRGIMISDRPMILAIVRDVTERKNAEESRRKLEQQMLHSQKLESLGVLAGGIAHDFNNILTAIIGNVELAKMQLTPESPVRDNIMRIETSALRAADLARQMLAYSGKGRFLIESIDLNRLVEEMLHMMEVSISKKAVLRLDLHRPLPSVIADATQIRQVLMNLVTNASEAIGDKSGIIAITTGCYQYSNDSLRDVWSNENLPEGLYVSLEVTDTGCGMDSETIGKIFDPFFTTKFTGRGLGMAALLGIVRGHKGFVKVYSEPGKGSTFKILLPAENIPLSEISMEEHVEEWHGSGTVLFVDDEETIRAIGVNMLKKLGFTTITAEDGCKALELYKEHRDIVLVILDLTMPHMDGEQTFNELRLIDHDVKIIMTSGFSESEVTQKFAGKGLTGFIQKPYTLSELRNCIKNISN